MKKLITITLAALLAAVSLWGCNTANNADNLSYTTTQGESNDKIAQLASTTGLERYNYFYDNIDKNNYDKWLNNELSKGIRAEKIIYAEYLDFWKTELSFTVQNGKELFDDTEEYEKWKSSLEQWLIIMQEILKVEMNSFSATMPQVEIIIPYCKLIRQKTIDTKYFLYRYEYEKAGMKDIDISVSIEWSPEASLLNID